MARLIRQFNKGAIVHILNRGVAKESIFRDKDDFSFYLYRIKNTLIKYPVGICAFNFLPNHVHYLMEQTTDISPNKFIASLHTSLANFINRKYSRVGHLFQNRYKLKNIKEEKDLLNISVYINMNKVLEELQKIQGQSISKDKLDKLLSGAERDPWSSYAVYLGLREDGITDASHVLSLLSDDIGKARQEYRRMAKDLITSGYFVKTRDLTFE